MPVPLEIQCAPIGELTAHIVWTHHRFLRSMLPATQHLASLLVGLHGDEEPQLRALSRNLDRLAGVLLPHMLVEERFLFPAITAEVPDRALIDRELAGAADEHALVARLLDEVRNVAATCALREISPVLADWVDDLDVDTRQHLALEQYALLPRVAP